MKTYVSFLAALVALLSSAGCVASRSMAEKNLPPDWIAALPNAGAPTADVAGVFVERGEQLNSRYARDGIIRSVNFSNLISLIRMDETEDHGDRRSAPKPSNCGELMPLILS